MTDTVVYLHRRLDNNEVFYVGIGSKYRAKNTTHRTLWWKRIVNKYGYSIDIINENLSWEEAAKIECELISEYGRLDIKTGILCNMTDGGEGTKGRIISEKHKSILRASNLGNNPSKETRLKMSKSQLNKKRSTESINKQVLTKLNSPKYKKGTSKYKGVSWSPKKKKWRSNIYINKKQTHLGYFTTEEDAYNKYKQYLKIKEIELKKALLINE